MTKNEFINQRTKIISKMLDNPNGYVIYQTTRCFAELDDCFDELVRPYLTISQRGPSWAQIERDKKNEV